MNMASDDRLVKHIVQYFKCENCEDYLRPPICICTEGTIICGLCSKLEQCKQQVVNHCSILENIGKFLTFPCSYSNYGCSVQLQTHNASNHETKCPLRQYQCPVGPQCIKRWRGTARNMNVHIQRNHLDLIIHNSVAIIYQIQNGKTVKFFFSEQELYVVIFECNTDLDSLWCSVMSMGVFEDMQHFYYKLTFSFKDSERYYQRYQIEPANSWGISSTAASKINLSVLKAKLQLKSDLIVDVKIEVFKRTTLHNGRIYNDPLRDVVCVVCHSYMSAAILECIFGHSFCATCKPKFNLCPFCGAKIAKRNFALESLSRKIRCICLYSDEGCTYTSPLSDIFFHEKNCNYGKVECPFKSFITDCKWRGRLDQIYLHALDDHSIKF